MRFILPILSFILAPVAVTACEGQCMVDITNAFLAHYTDIVLTVFQNLANQMNTQLVPAPARRDNPITYFDSVLEAYNTTAYTGLKTAIFPRYFHGKCQGPDGKNPPGCPNPDCATVCGTPGSLVHFYPDLIKIVFNETKSRLVSLTTPGSKTYNQVQQVVMADATAGHRKRMENLSRIMPLRNHEAMQVRGAQSTQQGLKKIMKQLVPIMSQTCGGPTLSLCNWEQSMKAYILQYP